MSPVLAVTSCVSETYTRTCTRLRLTPFIWFYWFSFTTPAIFLLIVSMGADIGQTAADVRAILGFTCIFLLSILYSSLISRAYIYTHKKRRPLVAYLSTEVFAIPLGSNKQQETYADMTNRPVRNDKAGYYHTHRHLLLLWFWPWFRKLRSFCWSNTKRQ